MKRLLVILVILIILFRFLPNSSFAVGDGNIDGGGGGIGSNLEGYYWSGADGVRITVVKSSDNSVVTVPFDLTNSAPDNVQLNFGKVSKIQYRDGINLSPSTSTYSCCIPVKPLPDIVTIDGNANIDAIKKYFCSEYTLMMIADKTGFNYDNLINGDYKVLLEPVAYFTVGGIMTAMTAHEAALYDQILGGELRQKIPSLTHKNLPLSMFLENVDLGFPAWDGPTTDKVSDNQIISSLGLGTVRFKASDEPVVTIPGDYEYRIDTDVITSVNLSTGDRITPDDPASVTFNINGSTHSVTGIVIPEGESQVVWVKWHTPNYPTTVLISISSNNGTLSHSSYTANVVDLKEKIPPNPTADDKEPNSFSIPAIPAKSQKTSASWGVWSSYWQPDWQWESDWEWEPDWVWVPDLVYDEKTGKWVDKGEWVDEGSWVDNGEWVDKGDWVYSWTGYTANLTASMSVQPDSKDPTAINKSMKSGYGINLNVNTALNTNAPSSAITGVQNVLSYYPEFKYNTYLRLSDKVIGGLNAVFDLMPNDYSTYGSRVHFTPVWFPNGKYEPVATIVDAWTPDGMLTCSLSDYVNINGSLFDDWHIAPK